MTVFITTRKDAEPEPKIYELHRDFRQAQNAKAYVIGRQKSNGFHVIKVVWGLTLAREERRNYLDAEIRNATILVSNKRRR